MSLFTFIVALVTGLGLLAVIAVVVVLIDHRFLSYDRRKRFTLEEEAQLFREMYSDDMSDEDYRKIYGDDEQAIREAKESWARAGQEVLDSYKKMVRDGPESL